MPSVLRHTTRAATRPLARRISVELPEVPLSITENQAKLPYQRQPDADGTPPDQPPPAHSGRAAWYRQVWALPSATALAGIALGAALAAGGPSESQLTSAEALADREVARAEAAEVKADEIAGDLADAEKAAAEARAAVLVAQDKAEVAEAAALKAAEAKLAKRVSDAETKLATRASELGAREAAVLAREKAVGTAEAVAAANTFEGNGVFLVGDDVQPGTYKSAGGPDCYWERNDRGGDILDNYLGDGATVVVIHPGDFSITTEDCAPFRKTR